MITHHIWAVDPQTFLLDMSTMHFQSWSHKQHLLHRDWEHKDLEIVQIFGHKVQLFNPNSNCIRKKFAKVDYYNELTFHHFLLNEQQDA